MTKYELKPELLDEVMSLTGPQLAAAARQLHWSIATCESCPPNRNHALPVYSLVNEVIGMRQAECAHAQSIGHLYVDTEDVPRCQHCGTAVVAASRVIFPPRPPYARTGVHS